MPIEFKNISGTGNFTLVNNTNSGNLILNAGGEPMPTPPPTPPITPSPTAAPTTAAPTVAPTAAPTAAPTTAAPTVAPTAAPTTPAPTSSGEPGTFSQTFTSGVAPGTAIENAWTAFRASLTGTYTTMTISNSLGQSITVTNASVQNIANALRTATTGTSFSVVIGANTWRVLHGCVSGTPDANSIYLTNDGACACGGAGRYTVRPMIKNNNWGGVNASSCAQPTQTITVTFS
jgi:hypothetical protein